MDAVGETPNIAARLQTLAAANTVLVSELTRQLVSTAFDLQDLGPQELRGITEPVRVHRVHAARNAASQFEAAHAKSLTPLTGRSSELNLLLDRSRIRRGRRSSDTAFGYSGSWNPRLLYELKSHIQEEPHLFLLHQCSPYHSQSAFFPVIEQIEQAAQITAREADADKIAKLQAYLPRLSDSSTEPLLLIAKLLSISVENNREQLGAHTPQIKNRTINALVDMLFSICVAAPDGLCLQRMRTG